MDNSADDEKRQTILEINARFEANRRRLFNLLSLVTLVEQVSDYSDKKYKKNRDIAEFWAKIHGRLPPQWREKESYIDELVRAGVVFLHAIFEDSLRQIARIKLSENPADTLDTITSGKRFTIGELSKLRGMTIDEVIGESIQEYFDQKSKSQNVPVDQLILNTIDLSLSHKSFNSTKDVVAMLEKLGIKKGNELEAYYPLLDAMMSRRHQIVHNADIQGKSGDNDKPTPITVEEVDAWVDNATAFIYSLIAKVLGMPLSFGIMRAK